MRIRRVIIVVVIILVLGSVFLLLRGRLDKVTDANKVRIEGEENYHGRETLLKGKRIIK